MLRSAHGVWLPVVVLALSGCSKAKKSEIIARSKDAGPAVVIVERTPSGVKVIAEKEPNNQMDGAAPLPLPGAVEGTLDGSKDVDLYRVVVENAVHVTVRLRRAGKVDLILALRDAEGKVLAKSDRGPATVDEGLPNYRLEPGTYYLAVSEFVKRPRRSRRRARRKTKAADEPPGRQGKSEPYELSIAVLSEIAEDHEREPNHSIDGARMLSVADYQVYGYAGWSGDVDTWKLSLEGAGQGKGMNIELSGLTRVRFTVEVLDDSGKRLLRRRGEAGRPMALRNLVPAEGAQAYYLKLSASRSDPEEMYELRYSTRLLDPDEEIEPNDSTSTATVLAGSGARSGSKRGYLPGGDRDVWRIDDLPRPMLFTVKVEPPHDVDVTMQLRTARGKLLGEANSGKRGGAESFHSVPIPAKTPVVLELIGSGASRPSEPYTITWSLGAAPTTPAPGSVDEP